MHKKHKRGASDITYNSNISTAWQTPKNNSHQTPNTSQFHKTNKYSNIPSVKNNNSKKKREIRQSLNLCPTVLKENLNDQQSAQKKYHAQFMNKEKFRINKKQKLDCFWDDGYPRYFGPQIWHLTFNMYISIYKNWLILQPYIKHLLGDRSKVQKITEKVHKNIEEIKKYIIKKSKKFEQKNNDKLESFQNYRDDDKTIRTISIVMEQNRVEVENIELVLKNQEEMIKKHLINGMNVGNSRKIKTIKENIFAQEFLTPIEQTKKNRKISSGEVLYNKQNFDNLYNTLIERIQVVRYLSENSKKIESDLSEPLKKLYKMNIDQQKIKTQKIIDEIREMYQDQKVQKNINNKKISSPAIISTDSCRAAQLDSESNKVQQLQIAEKKIFDRFFKRLSYGNKFVPSKSKENNQFAIQLNEGLVDENSQQQFSTARTKNSKFKQFKSKKNILASSKDSGIKSSKSVKNLLKTLNEKKDEKQKEKIKEREKQKQKFRETFNKSNYLKGESVQNQTTNKQSKSKKVKFFTKKNSVDIPKKATTEKKKTFIKLRQQVYGEDNNQDLSSRSSENQDISKNLATRIRKKPLKNKRIGISHMNDYFGRASFISDGSKSDKFTLMNNQLQNQTAIALILEQFLNDQPKRRKSTRSKMLSYKNNENTDEEELQKKGLKKNIKYKNRAKFLGKSHWNQEELLQPFFTPEKQISDEVYQAENTCQVYKYLKQFHRQAEKSWLDYDSSSLYQRKKSKPTNIYKYNSNFQEYNLEEIVEGPEEKQTQELRKKMELKNRLSFQNQNLMLNFSKQLLRMSCDVIAQKPLRQSAKFTFPIQQNSQQKQQFDNEINI